MRIDSPNLIGDITAASISNALGDILTIDTNNIIKRRTAFEILLDIGAQATLVSGTNIKTVNGESLLGSGNITITGGIGGSGTLNFIPKFSPNGTTLGNSQIFDNGTNVGIGTTTPSTRLSFGIADIIGEIGRIGFDVGTNQRSFISANRTVAVGQLSTLSFGTSGSERVTIGVSGEVTVNNLAGTGSGIVGTDASGNLIRYTIGSGLTLTGTTLTASGGSTTGLTGSGTSNVISMWSGATSLTNSVLSQGGSDARIIAENSINGLARLAVVNANTGTSAVAFNYASTTGNRYLGFIVGGANRTGTTAGLSNASLAELQSGASDITNLLIHASGNYPMVFAINQSEVMRIASSGNVGIGTTNPLSRVHAQSDSLTNTIGNSQTVINAGTFDGNNSRFQIVNRRFSATGDHIGVETLIGRRVDSTDFGHIGFRTDNIITFNASLTTERMRIASNGNVGIGTTNPLVRFQANGSISITGNNSLPTGLNGMHLRFLSNISQIYSIENGTAWRDLEVYANQIDLITQGTSRLIALPNGRILINSTSDNSLGQLQVNGNTTSTGYYKSGRLGYYGTYESSQVQGIWSIDERFPISTANNNFGTAYGMTYAYSTTGGAPITNQHQVLFVEEGIWGVSIAFNGEIRAKGDIVAFATSDKRLKDNLVYIENSLEKINKLGGYSFTWNNNQETYTGNDYGVVAQEVEALFPEMVTTRDNGYKAVKYEKLVPVLIEAVKELSREVKQLKTNK